jgi:hypothetical protein
MERNPLVVFERLFGDGSTAEMRSARRKEDRSVLDSITGDVARLRLRVGPGDRNRLEEYLDEIREIERRLRLVGNATADLPLGAAPVGVPQSFDEHARLMYDLQALAYKAEISRVSTFMYARDQTPRTYPDSGVSVPFHSASHHASKPEAMETFAKINTYHLQLLAHFLKKLQSTADGDGTLLDHSLILLGSTMSNGDIHAHSPLPMVVVGGASGRLKGGRHLRFPEHTPLSNLLLGVLHKVDIPMESFGDSTGPLEI